MADPVSARNISAKVEESYLLDAYRRMQIIRTFEQGISESIRPRSLKGLPARRNPLLEPAPMSRAMQLMSISLCCVPAAGAIGGASLVVNLSHWSPSSLLNPDALKNSHRAVH